MAKIYVRERTQVGRGEGRPRLAIVASSGIDLKIYQLHIRRTELEKLAEDAGAEIVYLPRGANAEEDEAARAEPGHRPAQGRRPRHRHMQAD